MRALARLFAALLLTLPLAGSVAAQQAIRYPTVAIGFAAGGLLPQGSFGDHADAAANYEVFVSRQGAGPWGARLTGQWAEYAHSDTSFALPGLEVKTRTGNSLSLVTLGPQVVLGRGALRGVLHAGLGGAWATTRTTVRAETNDTGDTNHEHGNVAFLADAALSLAPFHWDALWLEGGARWLSTGEIEYVPDGGIHRAAGQLVLDTRKDALSAVVLRAALLVRLGRP